MIDNKQLLDAYRDGFIAELTGEQEDQSDYNSFQKVAYELGSVHAYMGDDNPSIDKLTQEQILELIKDHWAKTRDD